MKTVVSGIGPIFTDRKALSKRAGYRSSLIAPRNELEIFCSLCVGRVYFDHSSRLLYYVDSPAFNVSDVLRQVFRGLGQEPQIEQLYMDEHRVIAAALRIRLTLAQAKVVMVALRLNGIHIDGNIAVDED